MRLNEVQAEVASTIWGLFLKIELIIKMVNPSSQAKQKVVVISKLNKKNRSVTISKLFGAPNEVNSIESPYTLSPISETIKFKGSEVKIEMKPYSFYVIRFPL